MKKYNSIDVWKMVMAVCVIAIHTDMLCNCKSELLKSAFNSFTTLAVPFFFLTSGFLIGNKINEQNPDEKNIEYIKKYLFKIIKLYLIWTLIYLPMAIYYFIKEGKGIMVSVLSYVRGFIFVGQQYNSWPLWYLLSTIYALILLIILIKILHLKHKKIAIVGSAIFIVSIAITCLTEYKGDVTGILYWIKKIVSYSIGSGRIFTGAFYIPIGIVLSKKELSSITAWMMLILGYILNVIIDNTAISTILVAMSSIGLFLIVKKICLPDAPIYYLVRKVSTIIYFIHMYIWTAYYMLVYGQKTYGIDSFLVTTIISSILAVSYIKIIETVNNRRMKMIAE